MQQVKLGSKVEHLGIQRVSVGEGVKCRAILLDQNPQMKHIAYDEVRKRRVEVDQDMCLKYGLRPMPTFYYLVARLNTDLAGRVIGDKFTVEYLQLSENLNNEFSDQVLEQGVPKSLSLTKVKKTANGKDYSYIKVVPSQMDPCEQDPSLAAKVAELRNSKEFIQRCWMLIDAATSLSKEQYETLLAGEGAADTMLPSQTPAGLLQKPSESTKQQESFAKSAMPQHSAPPIAKEFEASNSFGDDSDFGSDIFTQ